MKKNLLLSGLLLTGMTVMAQDVKTVESSQLDRITFNGDQVTLVYKNGETETIDDMSTVIINMSEATSIEERVAISEKAGLEGKAVYNLKGQLVGNSAARLEKGIYVIGGKKVIIK